MKYLLILTFSLFSTLAIAGSNDVVDIAISSKDHTTLVTAVKAADLVNVLKGEGPFTIFAPTNAAFNKLPDGTVASLLEPGNKDQLSKILTYHVVSGELNAAAIVGAIKKNGGEYTLTTLSGGKLIGSIKDGKVILTDESGNNAYVTATDLKGTNGIVHVIDSVVLPQ